MMNYFKAKDGAVFGYTDSDIKQTKRVTELETLITDKEPIYLNACNDVVKKQEEFATLYSQLQQLEENDAEESDINAVKNKVNAATKSLNDALLAFNDVEKEYLDLKGEYESVLPVFFDIREHLKVLKKMTEKEVQAHLTPQKSKEQLISEAEMQKQLSADEAEKNITILERKVRLNMATDDDKNNLTAWEVYSIKVADIDTSLASDINWPQKP